MTVQNPYVTGQPARGDDFVGRVRILNRVKKFICDDKTQNFLVIGKRRSGKTSLLKKIQDTHRSDELLILYLNMQKYIASSVETILSEIKRRLIRYCDIPQKVAEKQNFEDFLLSASNYRLRKILILFDEFDVMCKRENIDKTCAATANFAAYWYKLSLFTKNNKIPLKSLFASSFYCLFSDSPSCNQLFKSCRKSTLHPLSKSAVYRILDMGDLKFKNENILNEFFNLTAGNPFFTQVLSHTLFESNSVRQGEPIGIRLLWQCMRKALKAHGYGAAVIWGELSEQEQIILYYISRLSRKKIDATPDAIKNALTKGGFTTTECEIQKHLNKLEKEKFLNSDDLKIYLFSSNFFCEWILYSIKKTDISNNKC